MITDRTWVQVNLTAIRENYKAIAAYAQKPYMAVVKADAYGHGALEVAKVCESLNAPALAVACIEEAKLLREGGIDSAILILGVTHESRMKELSKYNVMQSVPSVEYANSLAQIAPNIKVHIKVDTGMGRLGVRSADEVRRIIKMLNVEGIFTHFADSDNLDSTYTNLQIERFNNIIAEVENDGFKFKCRHVANSAALLHSEVSRAYDIVRPGLLLYGLYPDCRHEQLAISPAMSCYTRVADVRNVTKGEYISYGCTYEVQKDMKVAVLPIGYADGLPRALSNIGEFYLNGKRVPILGRVCMDLCVVDVTDCPNVKVGDVAELFGENISADEIASKLDTISYEICTGISKRVPRVYIEE